MKENSPLDISWFQEERLLLAIERVMYAAILYDIAGEIESADEMLEEYRKKIAEAAKAGISSTKINMAVLKASRLARAWYQKQERDEKNIEREENQ